MKEWIFKAPCKPLRSQEHEHDQEYEEEKEQKQELPISAESKIDSALTQLPPSLDISTLNINAKNRLIQAEGIKIPLKRDTEFTVTNDLIEQWQQAFPDINVNQVLRKLQEWNIANPRKRKMESGILRHINLWLAREQEKIKNGAARTGNMNTLFNHNQSIADEWLHRDSVIDMGELH